MEATSEQCKPCRMAYEIRTPFKPFLGTLFRCFLKMLVEAHKHNSVNEIIESCKNSRTRNKHRNKYRRNQ